MPLPLKGRDNMDKENKIQTGLRVSEAFYEEIERAASKYGISKNALMTIAMRVGLNALNDVNQNRPPGG